MAGSLQAVPMSVPLFWTLSLVSMLYCKTRLGVEGFGLHPLLALTVVDMSEIQGQVLSS